MRNGIIRKGAARLLSAGLVAMLGGCLENAGSAWAEDGAAAIVRGLDERQLLADAERQAVELLAQAKKDLAHDEAQLRLVKNGKIDRKLAVTFSATDAHGSPLVFQSREIQRDASAILSRMIGETKSEIAAARQRKLLLVPYLWQTGWVSEWAAPSHGRVGRLSVKIKVFQVTSENSFLGTAWGELDREHLTWFDGISAANLSDGSIVDLCGRDDLFLCTGTKSYETALHVTKTVPAFRLLTTSEVAEVRRKLARPAGN